MRDFIWATETIEQYASRDAAIEALPGIKGQEGCLGVRVLEPKWQMRSWAIQAFFQDAGEGVVLPDGCKRRIVPQSMLDAMRWH